MESLYPVVIGPDYKATEELDTLKETLKITSRDRQDRQSLAMQILGMAREFMSIYPNKALSALTVAARHASGELKLEIVSALRVCANDPRIDNDARCDALAMADLYTPATSGRTVIPVKAPSSVH